MFPSVGFHFDLTYCCGNLETIGLNYTLHLEVEDCCEGRDMMEQMEDCMDEVEIITSPSYSVFTSSIQPSADIIAIPVVFRFWISKKVAIQPRSFIQSLALESPPPELYIQHQSFLC